MTDETVTVPNEELPRDVFEDLRAPKQRERLEWDEYMAVLAALDPPEAALRAARHAETLREAHAAAREVLDEQPAVDAPAPQPAAADGGPETTADAAGGSAGEPAWSEGLDDDLATAVEQAAGVIRAETGPDGPEDWLGSGAISSRVDGVSAFGLSWGDVADVLADHPEVDYEELSDGGGRRWRAERSS